MELRIKLSGIVLTAEIQSQNPEFQERCQRILNNSSERFEHVIAEAVRLEILKMLPDHTATCVAALSDEEDEAEAE